MARDFKRKENLDAISELNVTPLIDLAFSLLIIFMITTPLIKQNSIKVNLPSQDVGQPSPDPEEPINTITIKASGALFWDSDPVDNKQLSDRLEAVSMANPTPVIHLRADRELKYQAVVNVLNLIKKFKLAKLSLDTQLD